MQACAPASPPSPQPSPGSNAGAPASASARGRKAGAGAAAAPADEADPRTSPFAELLGKRLDRSSAGDTSDAPATDERDADAPSDTGDEAAIAVPSDPGSPAWWAQRLRAAARPSAAASADVPGGDAAGIGGGAQASRADVGDMRGERSMSGAGKLGGAHGGVSSSEAAAPHRHAAFGADAAVHTGGADVRGGAFEQAVAAALQGDGSGNGLANTPAGDSLAAAGAGAAGSAGSAASAPAGPVITDGLLRLHDSAAPPTAEAAPVPSHEITVPVHSPAFAPALGDVMTLLLNDGTHEARLQLHPTELGPVSVKIEVEGQQARVHFTAGAAETRDALQAAMPMLQQALQHSGLALAGGGVSGQGGSGHEAAHGRERPAHGRRGGDDDARADRASVRQITRGVIDCYA